MKGEFVSKQNVAECEGERNHSLLLRDILGFVGLTFALTIPFWIIGRASGNGLMPGLPSAALAVICPATAALVLSWRLTGVAGARALLMQTIDLGQVKPKAWWLLILFFSPAVSAAAFFISRNRHPQPADRNSPRSGVVCHFPDGRRKRRAGVDWLRSRPTSDARRSNPRRVADWCNLGRLALPRAFAGSSVRRLDCMVDLGHNLSSPFHGLAV